MMRGTTAVRPTVVAERMNQTVPCFNRIAMQQAPSRSSTGQPAPHAQAPQAAKAAPNGQSPPMPQIGSWEGPAKGMRLLSPRVQKVPTPQTVRSTSAESHPLTYMRGTSGRREEASDVRASTVDPVGQAFSRQARHSYSSPGTNLRGGCTGQGTVRKDRPPSATHSLVPVDEEMDAGDRGRVAPGMSGNFKPRGTQSPRASSQSGQAQNEAARLQYLESELALFTSKMTEMRSVAEALQEEIHISRPSPTSSITTGTPSGTPSFANASAGDVIEALKKVLSKDNHDSERALPFRSPSLQNDLMQEVRQLHQDMKLQAEAQKQLTTKMEAMFQEERAKRDEAFQQMEQRWQTSLQEESSLRRAVEGHIEERLTSSMREMRMEAGTASAKAQQIVNEFNQLRDNLRQEQNLQKLEIGNASADLSRLIDEVRKAGITGDVASVTSTEMTENLVRAEVRRQLAERYTEATVDNALSLEMQALAARLDHLERSLENEITSRQEEGSTFLCELHSLMKEQGQSHAKAFQDFEDAFKSKLDAVMSEVQTTKENCLEEEKVRRQQIHQETKDREETAVRILRAVEEKIISETKNCRQALVDQQGRLEGFVTNHGHAINKLVEKNSEELQAAQNDLLQLRDELKEARDDWKVGSPPFKLGWGAQSWRMGLSVVCRMESLIEMSRLLRAKLRPQIVHCFCRAYSVLYSRPITSAWKFTGKNCKHNDSLRKLKFFGYARGVVEMRWQHTLSSSLEPKTSIVIRPDMTIRQLASEMTVDPGTLADMLIDLGEDLPHGLFTVLSPDLAELLVLEHKMTPIHSDIKETASFSLLPRPPVVTIMGHVDHGKTTLLDTLRRTSVAAEEAGGITQHIGAFSVHVPGADKTITFIDTPGHAAFETMRARGANVTDIVVLIVAADDGVKQQTVESIKHATRARVPIIVAINKVDKPKVNVEQAKQQLLQHGVQLEEFGGDIQAVEISALNGTNFDGLLEAITTLAELHDLKANRNCPVEGIVLESRKDKGKGSIATVLVKSGTLRKGSIIVSNQAFAKVRLMLDDQGNVVSEATPSTPVEVTGWRELPSAGDEVFEVKSEQEAHDAVSKEQAAYREKKMSSEDVHNILLDVDLTYKREPAPKQPNSDYDSSDKLNIIVKGDVDGSIEAINDAIATYKSKKIKLNVLSSKVGAVNENDIRLAQTFKGLVFCFNVKNSNQVQSLAKRLGISIKQHKIIYKLLEDIKDELSNKLPPFHEESVTGEAAVLKVFKLTGARKATVAGCRVMTGTLVRGKTLYKILRNNNVIFEGKLATMKRGMDDISQAKRETECGLSFEKFTDIQEGDVIQCCTVTVKEQEIDWDWGF